MKPMFFTVKEANKQLPGMQKAFDKIFRLNKSVKDVSKDIQGLIDIWGEEIFDSRNVDNKFYMEKIDQRAQLIENTHMAIEEVNSTGCVVKDVDLGLVDFLHKKGNEIIFLCWQYGEDRIHFWHSPNAGFINRRPIEELAQAV